MTYRNISIFCLICFSSHTSAFSNPLSNVNGLYIHAECEPDSEEIACYQQKIANLTSLVKEQQLQLNASSSSDTDEKETSQLGTSLGYFFSIGTIIITGSAPLSQLVQNTRDSVQRHQRPVMKDISWASIDLVGNLFNVALFLDRIYIQKIALTVWDYAPQAIIIVIEAIIVGSSLYFRFKIKRSINGDGDVIVDS